MTDLPAGFDPTGVAPAVVEAVRRVYAAHPEAFASVAEDGWAMVRRPGGPTPGPARRSPTPAAPGRPLTPAEEIRTDPRWAPYRAQVLMARARDEVRPVPAAVRRPADAPTRDKQRRLRHRLLSGLTAQPEIGFEWFAAKLLARLAPPDAAIELARNRDWLAEHGSVVAIERFANLLRDYAGERFGADPDFPGSAVDRAVRKLEGR